MRGFAKSRWDVFLLLGMHIHDFMASRLTARMYRPHNVPFQLTLVPLIGAIAAGNVAVIKPSEATPASSALMQSILANYLDSSCYTCIQGAVPETTALLNLKWDKIFFTGSVKVAKIVAKKASETLTPYVLELGGRNPAIVTKNADLRLAARRLLWAKFHNAGQICVSQNYILVEESALSHLIKEFKEAIQEFYPDGAKQSPDYGRIVNKPQWERLRGLVHNTQGKTIIGGAMDEADFFMEPTFIQIDNPNDSIMLEENFGPIVIILPYKSLDEAIRIARETQSTPLGIYPFGTKRETDYILDQLQSGGASVNDGWIHCTIPTMAFGGVGDSGTGSYRGRASFDCFSHRRAVTTSPGWAEGLLSIRYPPYAGKLDTFQNMTSLEPSFDREGKPHGALKTFAGAIWAGSMRLGAMTGYAFALLGELPTSLGGSTLILCTDK